MAYWTRGEVVNGNDFIVRGVDVQTVNGVLQRPVTKVAVLDVALGDTTEETKQQYGSRNVDE